MRFSELAWVGTLSRRLDLNESDERLADSSGIVGTRFQVRLSGLADEMDGTSR
jgi:hypothetical protein